MENENVIESVNSDINNSREKRIRKSVSRLSDVYDKTFEMKSDRIIKPITGNGIKFGDIKRIQDAIHRSKLNGELSKNMHLLCYRTIGKAGKRLSSIKKFNGFDENDESEFKKRLSIVDKMKMDDLKLICDLLNVHPSGKMKKDVALGLVEYLRCPFETGSEIFRTSALRRKIKGGKNKPTVKSVKKTKALSSNDDDDVSMDSSVSNIEDGIKSSDEISENDQIQRETPEKSNGKSIKKEKASNEKQNHVPKSKKSEREKSIEVPNKEVEHSFSSDSHSEISDELLKEKITAILSGADLSKITLNQVCDGVVDQFPDVDLVLRRPHIKSLVKQVIDQSS